MKKTERILFAVFLLLIILSVFPFADPVKYLLFSVPSGWLASVLCGGGFLLENSAAVVELEDVRILIPASCSGTVFFLLLSLLIILYGKMKWLWIGPVAGWFVNALRVLAVAAWTVSVRDFPPFPPEFQHQTIGLTVFLAALVFSAALLRSLRTKKNCADSAAYPLEKEEEGM